MSSKKTAIVTGGAGFIGSHMVDCLIENGFSVRAIDNLSQGKEINLKQHAGNPDFSLDTRDIRQLKPNDSVFSQAEYVFHFAGLGAIVPSIDQPTEYLSVNVQGTVHALECARHAGVKKFIYAASSSCYGLATELPTTESATLQPQYPYALSKYMGEEAVMHWGRLYRLPANSIRMFNVYGTRSSTSGVYGAVFGVFLKQILSHQPLTVVGDGTQTRDFVYVTDVAKAYLMLAQSKHSNEIYNLGAGKPQSVNRLVELIKKENDVVHVPKRPGEPDCTWADISKIQTHTGWKPEVSFEKGVSKMLENIDYWREAPLWDVKTIEAATKGWFSAFQSQSGV